MRRSLLFTPLWLLLAAGCISAPPPARHFSRPANFFPPDGLLVQRALMSTRGRQFALNGYLALSKTGGQRLIVTDTLGMVMADLLVKPDGKVYVLRSSWVFPARQIRRLMAADVECIFGSTPAPDCPVTMLDTNHFLLDRGNYKLDLRIVETKGGVQPAEMFDENTALKK